MIMARNSARANELQTRCHTARERLVYADVCLPVISGYCSPNTSSITQPNDARPVGGTEKLAVIKLERPGVRRRDEDADRAEVKRVKSCDVSSVNAESFFCSTSEMSRKERL